MSGILKRTAAVLAATLVIALLVLVVVRVFVHPTYEGMVSTTRSRQLVCPSRGCAALTCHATR